MEIRSLSKPLHVNFEIVGTCNESCTFCAAELTSFPRRGLTSAEIMHVLKELGDNGVYSVFLTGGEPASKKDLPEIIRRAIDLGINVTTATNGTLINRRLAETLKRAGLDEIQVSIHGTPTIHDSITGLSGSYERAVNAVSLLKECGIDPIVASVGMKRNYKSLPALARIVADHGAVAYRILRLMPNRIEMVEEVLGSNEVSWLIDEISSIREETDLELDLHIPSGCVHEQFFDPSKFPTISHPLMSTCTAGKATMAVLADGLAAPCVELKQLPCGNILDLGLEEVWNSPTMNSVRSVTPESYSGECARCQVKNTCYSARCVAYRFDGSILGDDVTCVKLRN